MLGWCRVHYWVSRYLTLLIGRGQLFIINSIPFRVIDFHLVVLRSGNQISLLFQVVRNPFDRVELPKWKFFYPVVVYIEHPFVTFSYIF